jgi:hypothetical protein
MLKARCDEAAHWQARFNPGRRLKFRDEACNADRRFLGMPLAFKVRVAYLRAVAPKHSLSPMPRWLNRCE